MEADAGNRGRGRPPIFSDVMLDFARAGTTATTRRTLQNRLYGLGVISDLVEHYKGDERLDWLVSDERARWSLLSELGRLRDVGGDDAFYEAADWLLENQPKVKYGEALLRRFRTGEAAPASADALYEVLRTALEDYQSTHPVKPGQAEAALRRLLADLA